ncbi:unnamed protein product [Anisakis simplex]|uniref:RING-type domain-containing protein n=1 Tax=Anisakis simplex TaxID=6269 RepID=A0A158PMV7_ANISI|nr:unnamed protein product [Anisakis simplex]
MIQMRTLGTQRALSGAGSSTPSEEGFVSGCFSLFDIQQSTNHQNSLQQKCCSESGASYGENERSAMLVAHDMTERITSESMLSAAPLQYVVDATSTQLPGSWFYEIGSDETSGSPTGEFHDEFRSALSLGARNVTESVEVPSSEHVAEIVGRQGCKIKALRAKTNTYIKTPVRGEEPVFVVTGKPEDVADAKREIECAAEHFTQIRASRRHSQGGAPAPGHITAYVRVPLRVVGLVVGPKGATIKRIQQDTHTYIITPSREREPIFEVTGLPHNVDAARREIEQHIYQRTGNMPITDPNASIQSYDIQGNVTSTGSIRSSGMNYSALAQQPIRRQSTVESLTNGTASGSLLSNDLHKSTANDLFFDVSAFNKLIQQSHGCGVSSSGSPPPSGSAPTSASNCYQSSSSAASTGSCSISSGSGSSSVSSSHLLYNALDLCSLNASTLLNKTTSQVVIPPQTQQHFISDNALLSSHNSTPTPAHYQPWSAVYSSAGLTASSATTGSSQDFNTNQTSTNNALITNTHSAAIPFLSSSSRPSLGSILANMAGGCSGASNDCASFTTQHSSSLRDEGIGESPSFNVGALGAKNNDPYHLMMASIWSDLEGTTREQPPSAATTSVDNTAVATA